MLGEALVTEGRPLEALEVLEPVADDLGELAGLRFDADVERSLARARVGLVRAHLATVADDAIVPPAVAARVLALLDDAERWIETTGSAAARTLAALGALRRRVTARPR